MTRSHIFKTEMRNYKLRISALIPCKWFHKLKNMTKPREKNPLPSRSYDTIKKKNPSADSKPLAYPSSSYFSNRSHTSLRSKILQISPRNSLHMIHTKRKTVYKPSPPSSSSATAGYNKNKNKNKFLRNHDFYSVSSNLKLSSSADDIIIDINNRVFKERMFKETEVFDSAEKACRASNQTKEKLKTHHLVAKVISKEKESDPCRFQKKHQQTVVSRGRRSSANSPGIKLRASSPKIQVSYRRSKSRSLNRQILDSFAVIKSSVDPKQDFRESMVEMIAENNMRDSKDLEDLLACYLSLNPNEYHDLIINVFVQVWLQLVNSTFAPK